MPGFRRLGWGSTVFLMVFSFAVEASGAESVALSEDAASGARESSPWRVFGGASFGRAWVSGDEYSEAPGGGDVALSILGSYRGERWGVDAGAGWRRSVLSGKESDGRSVEIRTRSGFAELFPNARIGSRWQAGPLASLDFGTDTGFGPEVLKSSPITPRVGLRAIYEIPTRTVLIRWTAQALTDLSLEKRQVWSAMTGLQIGLPLRAARSAEGIDVIRTAQAVPRSAPSNEVRIVLDSQKVFFSTNSSQVRLPVKEILGRVGTYLAANRDSWGTLEISGHADQRGSYAANLKLSRKRAESVLRSLSLEKLPADEVRLEALSYTRPIDPRHRPEAWAKNRRVELVFRDVREPEVLVEEFRALAARSFWKNEER